MKPGRVAALGLPGLVLSIGFGQLLNWGDAQAWHGTNNPNPDFGYLWKDAKLIGGAVTDDHTVANWGYGPIIINRVNDWYNTTGVKPTNGTVADHASNRVHYHSVRVGTGAGSFLGKTSSYSIQGYASLQPCFNSDGSLSGLCNKTDHRATYADIDINDDLLAPGKQFGNDVERNHTMGHEMGHIFGLTHPTDCIFPSGAQYEAIMRTTGCAQDAGVPVFQNVRGHDAFDTAILYP